MVQTRQQRKEDMTESDAPPDMTIGALDTAEDAVGTRENSPTRSVTSVASTIRRRRLLDIQLEAADRMAQIEKELVMKKLRIQEEALKEKCDSRPFSRAPSVENLQVIRPGNFSSHLLNPRPIDVMQTTDLSKFLARQTSNKELTFFSGDPEDWPMFYSQYKSTTRLCGFSDDENIARLSRCLKGRARDAVSALLVSATNIDKIIDTLKLRFGRPEYIIDVMLSKIRAVRDIRHDDVNSLIEFATSVQNVVAAMTASDETGQLMNTTLIREVIGKLPSFLKCKWSFYLFDKDVKHVTLIHVSEWLMMVANAVTHIAPMTTKSHIQQPPYKPQTSPPYKPSTTQPNKLLTTPPNRPWLHNTLSSSNKADITCAFCKSDHEIKCCPEFLSLTIDDRWRYVTESKLCFSCLSPRHQLKECKKRIRCTEPDCLRRHHPLLHALPIHVANKPKSISDNMDAMSAVNNCKDKKDAVMLKVLPVVISGPKGEIKVLALLDEGAALTLVDETVIERVGVTGPSTTLQLNGAKGMTSTECTSKVVSFNIRGRYCSDFFKLNNVRSVNNLNLPVHTVNFDKLVNRFPYLYDFVKDFDISTYDQRPLILIGSDNIELIVTRQVYQGPKNGPIVSKTYLGNVIHGKLSSVIPSDTSVFHLCACDELTEAVKRFYTTEAFGTKPYHDSSRSREDEKALEIMRARTRHLPSGRWETGLLWKQDDALLPKSYPQARSRLTGIQKKMLKLPNFREQYASKINANIVKGYVSKLSTEEASVKTNKTWYLPHFAVFNPNKSNKLRLVFDAAAKSEGKSLNDFLVTGPDLLTFLPGILLGFRSRKIAVIGDIQEMFHRVMIREEDRQAQRFLWESDEYVMNVMTFGAACSPSCAQFVKNENARKFEQTHPQAVKAIIERHYVDDFIYSVDNEDNCKRVVDDVLMIHAAGGFNMTNFMSNSKEVLKHLPDEKLAPGGIKFLSDVEDERIERVLGVNWDPDTDCFTFLLNLLKIDDKIKTGQKRPTKREVLKVIMSVFDPLGFLLYVTVNARILLQDIWKSKTGWDDEIETTHFERWQLWLKELLKTRNVKIPRWLMSEKCIKDKPAELHVFCDASSKAFACTGFARFRICENTWRVVLIMARARVAPLKAMSIPRLELQAAVMGARLGQILKKYVDWPISRTYYWTDSKTVLAWIRSDTGRFKPFVAHRVSEVTELTELHDWRWVPTHLNPADDATRDEIIENKRWLSGPDFLRGAEDLWPTENVQLSLDPDDVEVKHVYATFYNCQNDLPDITRFSSYWRLIRTTAWMFRFIHNIKKKDDRRIGELSALEIKTAELIMLKCSQRRFYAIEIEAATKMLPVDKCSSLRQLTPFLDSHKLLRVGGRIDSATVDDETKHPVILHPKDRFVRLLMHQYHKDAAHVGREHVLNNLRRRFWIVNGRNAVKSVWNECQVCKNSRAKPSPPLMGQLPDMRLEAKGRAFSYTGLDYFGPINVKVGRRHEKRYGALFTCLTVRAVHIELVHDLTTSSAIMALRRFIARRGCPKQIWSDNATTFRGAAKELRQSVERIDRNDLIKFGSIRKIEWNFIAPNAPHMGGCWERLIRSIKVALKATLKEKTPTDQTLQTLLAEAEFMVNRRPLTYVPLDHTDDLPLTPLDFLLTKTEFADYPFDTFTDRDLLKRNWREAQRLTDLFWRRWVREYLPTLTRRDKWFRSVEPLVVGDLVIIADDQMPRNLWMRGMVSEVYPGKDGQVRVVDVKIGPGQTGSTYRRPVTKLCRLDVRSQA